MDSVRRDATVGLARAPRRLARVRATKGRGGDDARCFDGVAGVDRSPRRSGTGRTLPRSTPPRAPSRGSPRVDPVSSPRRRPREPPPPRSHTRRRICWRRARGRGTRMSLRRTSRFSSPPSPRRRTRRRRMGMFPPRSRRTRTGWRRGCYSPDERTRATPPPTRSPTRS